MVSGNNRLTVGLDWRAAVLLLRQRAAWPILLKDRELPVIVRGQLEENALDLVGRRALDTYLSEKHDLIADLLVRVADCTFKVRSEFLDPDLGEADVIVVSPIQPGMIRRENGDDELYVFLTSEIEGVGWTDCEQLRRVNAKYEVNCRYNPRCDCGPPCRLSPADHLVPAGANFMSGPAKSTIRIMRPAEAWTLIFWLVSNLPKLYGRWAENWEDRMRRDFPQARASAMSIGRQR